jgi:hypothetical protein
MAIVPTITNIDKSECIGNSLVSINSNYTNIQESLVDVNSNIVTINSLLTNLTTIVSNISSDPQRASAWANFSGIRDAESGFTRRENTNRLLFTSYNITSILRENTGIYRVSMTNPVTSRFCVVGTTTPLAPGTAGQDAGVVNTFQGVTGSTLPNIQESPSEFRIVTRTLLGVQYDPASVNIVVFST